MTDSTDHRLRRIGWLLTPLVVWAASFFGAWLGAMVAARVGGPRGGVGLMIGGALGMVIGAVVVWTVLLRRRSHPPRDAEP